MGLSYPPARLHIGWPAGATTLCQSQQYLRVRDYEIGLCTHPYCPSSFSLVTCVPQSTYRVEMKFWKLERTLQLWPNLSNMMESVRCHSVCTLCSKQRSIRASRSRKQRRSVLHFSRFTLAAERKVGTKNGTTVGSTNAVFALQ